MNRSTKGCLAVRTRMTVSDGLTTLSSASLQSNENANTNRHSWFIKKGEEIVITEGVRRQYGSTLAANELGSLNVARIVMSTLPAKKLPMLATDAGCQFVSVVHYKLTENDMKLKNRQVWKMKKKYWKANFSFVVKLGPADMKFEILGKDGVVSSDHKSLAVEYMDPSEKTPSNTVVGGAYTVGAVYT